MVNLSVPVPSGREKTLVPILLNTVKLSVQIPLNTIKHLVLTSPFLSSQAWLMATRSKLSRKLQFPQVFFRLGTTTFTQIQAKPTFSFCKVRIKKSRESRQLPNLFLRLSRFSEERVNYIRVNVVLLQQISHSALVLRASRDDSQAFRLTTLSTSHLCVCVCAASPTHFFCILFPARHIHEETWTTADTQVGHF